MRRSRISCQLSVYPDYLNAEMGFDFSERFHTDPEYRNEKWKEVVRWVNSRFGRWGCGHPEPDDSYSVTTLDSVHLTSHLFGSKVTFYPDRFPDCHDYPLSSIPALREFVWRTDEVMRQVRLLLCEAKRLIDLFGAQRVAMPYYYSEYAGMTDMEAAHCPLTIAYRLFGERLLVELYDDPDGVRHVFQEINAMSKEVGALFREVFGKPMAKSACVGACGATLIGPSQFRDFLMPVVLNYADGRPLLFHSCGNVNRLFGVFGEMNDSNAVKVFDCREQAGVDIESALEAFPEAAVSYMFSPPACLTRTPAEMSLATRRVVEQAGGRPLHLILNLPSGAADAAVDSFFETCQELGADKPSKPSGFAFA